jgi:hypothetical protein
MTARQRAAEAWVEYMASKNDAIVTNSIADIFYSRIQLAVWFDACEDILKQEHVSLSRSK